MRRGHRGAADGLGRARTLEPGAFDVLAGGEQVQTATPVAEAGAGIVLVGGAHGQGLLDPRRRHVAGVLILVPGRRDNDHLGAHCAFHRFIHTAARTAAQAEVGDRRVDVVLGDPVDAGDYARSGSAAVATQHPNRMQHHALGDAVLPAADGAGHMGAVAIAVLGRVVALLAAVVAGETVENRAEDIAGGLAVFIDAGKAFADASAEVLVITADAGVDHVDVHAIAVGAGIKSLIQRQRRLIDAVQAPGRVALTGHQLDLGILFHEAHPVIGRQTFGLQAAHLCGKTDKRGVVDVVCAPAVEPREGAGDARDAGQRAAIGLIQCHDVAAINRIIHPPDAAAIAIEQRFGGASGRLGRLRPQNLVNRAELGLCRSGDTGAGGQGEQQRRADADGRTAHGGFPSWMQAPRLTRMRELTLNPQPAPKRCCNCVMAASARRCMTRRSSGDRSRIDARWLRLCICQLSAQRSAA